MKEFSVSKPLYYAPSIFQVALGCLSISLLILYAQWRSGRRKLYEAAGKFKGPFPWPLVGSVFRFYGNDEKSISSILTLHEEYESPVAVWIGHKLFFACNTPEDMEIILNSPQSMEKAEEVTKYASEFVGKGLVTAPAEMWKRHRKLISPTFSQKILDTFVPIFSENAKVLVEVLKEDLKTTKNGALDIADRIAKCTFDIICETAMGQEMNTQRSTNNDIVHYTERGMYIVFEKMTKIWLQIDLLYNLTSLAKEQKVILETFQQLTDQVITTKKTEYQSKQKELEEYSEDFEQSKVKKAFLDHLIEQSVFTDEELRDETRTFMIAGSDTTSTILSFVMICLAMHQDVQQKAYDEVMDMIGPNRDIVNKDLPNLKYLERAIKETMRFFPIGATLVRLLTGDLELSNNNVLPAGSSVVLSIFQLQHNADYWPDPWKFDPDRFLPEAVAKRHPYAYLPFSGGHRNCIGFKFAYMAMKVIVANILRSFRLETDYKDMQSVRCKQTCIIASAVGYKVRLYER